MDVNQKELAAILGITDRRVRQLKNEFGLFSKGLSSEKKQKNYVLEKCVPEYINYKLEAEVQQGTGYNKEKEQAEHEQIKKKISILKLRKLKRELHEAVSDRYACEFQEQAFVRSAEGRTSDRVRG